MSPKVNNGRPLFCLMEQEHSDILHHQGEGGDQRDFAFAKVHFTHFHAHMLARPMSMRYRGFQEEQFHRPSGEI